MGKIAFLFAGQGAQAPGMGKSLYDLGGSVRETFTVVEAARPGTLDDCFNADAERLAQTSVTQPCVYTVDLAAAMALVSRGVQADGAAGFSLGEVAALAFAQSYSLQDGAQLVAKRGQLMAEANAKHPGAMAAVLRMQDDAVEALCKNYKNLWPVNYNSPGQLVVAGDAAVLPDFCAAVKEARGVAKILPVGGAFHTPFMEEASAGLAEALADIEMKKPGLPVYANKTAMPYAEPLKEPLAAQMVSPVRWTNTILRMQADGFDTFVEVGPGKTLSGLVRRILPEARVMNVEDADSLAATAQVLAK